MRQIKPTQRIVDVIGEIREDNYRLPSIQRSFVWEEERIYKLMDSLMNGYPIGSFLVWKPNIGIDIRTKKFIQEYFSGERRISDSDITSTPPYLVLDGQQRLQSLFLAFYGKYNGKQLYFKVNSDPQKEENDLRYNFQFLTTETANNNIHWVKPLDIIGLNFEDINEYVTTHFTNDDPQITKLISKNLSKFFSIFNISEKIVFQEVKSDLPYNDVLEVFVRVNSGGIVLSKSDLLFSTVILHSPTMEKNFIETVDILNGGGEFEFDIDFIIKCSFVLLGRGAKYDIAKLRDGAFISDLERNFEKFKTSLLSGLQFLKTDAKILSKRFLKSDLALIPIIDFIFKQSHQQIPEGQALKMKQYLYMSYLMRFYSYGPDGKLDALHKIFNENRNSTLFPINEIKSYLESRTSISYSISDNMLSDLDIILNIIQGGVTEIPKSRGWSLETDHIFPSSLLRQKHIHDDIIDDVGNLRYINKIRNILKSDMLPSEDIEYFGSNDPTLKPLFLEARRNLNEQTYNNFVTHRKNMIKQKVTAFLF